MGNKLFEGLFVKRAAELGGVAYVGRDSEDTQGGGEAQGRPRAVGPTRANHFPPRIAVKSRRAVLNQSRGIPPFLPIDIVWEITGYTGCRCSRD